MKNKERVIDLRQFFIYLWENILILIIVGALGAGALAVRDYKKQKSSAAPAASLQGIIRQNQDSFFNVLRNYTDTNKPAHTAESRVKLYMDFNIDGFEDGEKLDNNNIITQLSNDACYLVVSESAMDRIIEKLDLRQYDDMKNITGYDLSWIVNKNMQGVHIMNITVTDVNAARAHDIAEAVAEEFMANAKSYGLVKDIKVIDKASRDADVVIGKSALNKKGLIKKFIVGGALGVVMTVVILLIIFIIKDAVRTGEDIDFSGLERFGRFSLKKKVKEENLKKFAAGLDNPKYGKVISLIPLDKGGVSVDIVDGIKGAFEGIGKKAEVITSEDDIPLYDDKKIAEKTIGVDYLIICTKDLISSADARVAIKHSDSAVLLAGYGKTRMASLLDAAESLKDSDAGIIGVTLLG